uniref:Periviscerokinin-1 n=1 Tax=Mastotermes darwiniensis TaxID=13139 RepID=PVK1_MASDA|nr:RecName: Full=Periviscerokinin-1; Short=MasDa-PVK-1 [Mastotermes darwiniensis]
ASSGLISMPRV